MAFRLPRLPRRIAIVEAGGQITTTFQKWWQSVVSKIEEQEDAQTQLLTDFGVAQTTLAEAVDALTEAQGSITGLDTGKQDANATLQGLSEMAPYSGLIEQIGEYGFTHRFIGVGGNSHIPTTGDGDARWVEQNNTPTWTLSTGTNARDAFATYTGASISNPPTAAQVQVLSDYIVILTRQMKALKQDLIANGTLLS